MEWIPFPQRLKNANVDIRKEYERLYNLFYLHKIKHRMKDSITMRDFCAYCFLSLPFRKTCISLEDYDTSFGFHFEENPCDFNLDYLLSFCEYSYNLLFYSDKYNMVLSELGLGNTVQFYLHQVLSVIESIGYMGNDQNGLIYFVPKDQVVISVAEKVDPNVSYRVIEYNHHSMKGNLEKKRAILLVLADQLEPYQVQLREFNKTLAKDLFFLLNNVNVRHNNIDQNGASYNPYVANMKKEELENWYDTIYHLCLIAFLELEHLKLEDSITQLKKIINPN